MKIGLVCEHVNKAGGISRYTAELLEHMSKAQEVHLFASSCKGVQRDRLTVHTIRSVSKPFFLDFLLFTLRSTIEAKKEDFDILHSPMVSHLDCDVVTAQSCHRAYFQRIERFRGAKSLIDPLHRMVMAFEGYVYRGRRYKKIISVSEGVKREIVHYYGVPPGDITVIPNGVDLKKFRPDAGMRKRARAALNISGDDFVLLFVAHEFERKGLAHIINALSILNEPKAKLVVVGSDDKGPYEKLAAKTGTSRQVTFAGPSKKVEEFYAAADAFVFPTSYEAFSLATVEAMAAGLPLLATKVNGTEELIADGRNGFFVSTSPEDIAEKAGRLLVDRRLLERMGRAARKTAEKYVWSTISERTLDVYKEVLEQKSGRGMPWKRNR